MINDPREEIKLNINGLETRVFTYGEPKNPPIFYIHGYFRGFSSLIGDLPIRHLMKNYYVICFDLPKYGWSKAFKEDNSEFIYKIQKQILGERKVCIFGVSYGGLVALKYAKTYPSSINSLIIAGTPVFYGVFKFYKLVRFLTKNSGNDRRENYNDFDFFSYENLSKINTPVLLIYGLNDIAANIFMGRKLNKMLPKSKLILIKGKSHKWLLDRIDQNGVLERINEFLQVGSSQLDNHQK